MKVKIPATCKEAILNDCFTLLEQIDKNYNSYQSQSYFANINAHAGNWVTVDDVTVHILHQLKNVYELTNGAYDITAMPLLKLWGFYKEHNTAIPNATAIAEELKKVDFSKIEIKEHQVKIAANQEVITGSFIKAYAVDCLVNYLKEKGITDAVINAGGSTIYALTDKSHPSWKIHIPHPEHKDEKTTISLSNQCFSLSARAHNYITINHKKYGHILNAKTGYPSGNLQVGVLSETAFLGDVYATALFSLPAKQFYSTAKYFVNSGCTAAYMIDDEHEYYNLNFSDTSSQSKSNLLRNLLTI